MGKHGNWYKLKLWRQRREIQLLQHPLCAMCAERGLTVQATVADHDPPHRGDWETFTAGALQSLCKACHDGPKQSQELRGFSTQVGLDGWPADQAHPANSGEVKTE